MEIVNKIMMKLMESPKLDPEKEISHLIPKKKGIYAWFNKRNDCLEYIGKATGENGLYQRIIKQHLNEKYLLTNQSKWRKDIDSYQIENYIILNNKPAIDKSAFRKNISRLNKLKPGSQSVDFIKKNFYLRFIEINDKDEAKKLERQLIERFKPKYNIQ